MDNISILLSPLNLLFFIVVIGLSIGKIRIKGISVGIAGILFASIFVGFLIKHIIPEGNSEIIINAQSSLKTFSKLGSSLFVSVIGLQTGFSIKNGTKNSIISFAIGVFMSISGIMVMLIISMLDKTIKYSSLLGILCGALTSTPGLSSICELVENESEYAILGYSCSYLLGVILVVIFAQLSSQKNTENNLQHDLTCDAKNTIYPEILLICITAIGGNIIGNINIIPLTISFGSTASTLIIGLIVGYVVLKNKQRTVSNRCLSNFKNFGLTLFLAGTGFTTGTECIVFDVKSVLYGMLITLSSILGGWLICKLVKKLMY